MAAKLIQVSDDSGATWYTLPGSTGSLQFDADQIEDTVFGNTFQSNEAGLIGWSVEANARYKGFAGYQAKILQSGAATPEVGEAMGLESGKIYRITDDTKAIWDRTATITVYDDASDETANIEWIDYLFGRIKFLDSYTVLGVITVDVSWLATSALGTASSFTLTQTAEAIDNTDFATAQANTGYKTHESGLRIVSLELTGFYNLASGLLALLDARAEVIIEINPDGSQKSVARGFFRAVNEGQSGDVGALEEETTTFQLNVPDDALMYLPFHWDFANDTTLSQAVQVVLAAWEGEIPLDVQYLEDGVNGEKGVAIVTDVTLTSGLDAMNEFASNFMGSGVTTIVP